MGVLRGDINCRGNIMLTLLQRRKPVLGLEGMFACVGGQVTMLESYVHRVRELHAFGFHGQD